jgi:hypothetical protein
MNQPAGDIAQPGSERGFENAKRSHFGETSCSIPESFSTTTGIEDDANSTVPNSSRQLVVPLQHDSTEKKSPSQPDGLENKTLRRS